MTESVPGYKNMAADILDGVNAEKAQSEKAQRHVPRALLGEKFILLQRKSKYPLPLVSWTDEDNHHPAQYVEYFLKDDVYNYGVVTTAGTNLCVIDADDADAIAAVIDRFKGTFTVKSGRTKSVGKHVYLRINEGTVPPELEGKKLALQKDGKDVGDIRLPGFVGYTVAPYSIHESGKRYLPENDDADILCIDAKDLLNALKDNGINYLTKAEKPIEKPSYFTNHSNLDEYGLNVFNFLSPENPHRRGDEIEGGHPIHHSETGTNFTVTVDGSRWYCRRHNTGGGLMKAIAVSERIIDCEDANRDLTKEELKKCYEVLREKNPKVYEKQRKEYFEQKEKSIKERKKNKTEPKPQEPEPPLTVSDRVKGIYESGQLLDELVKSSQRLHIGDERIFKALYLCIASTFSLNCEGINILITGSAGNGKTHIMKTVERHLQDKQYLDASLSDKALFYTPMNKQTAVILDDQALSEDMQGLLKKLNWEKPTQHITVNNKNPLTLTIPERCPFIVVKAEGTGDEQIMDRELKFWADESEAQEKKRIEHMLNSYKHPEENDCAKKDIDEFKAVWSLMTESKIIIPFADRITGGVSNARNLNLLMSLIHGSCILHAPVRKCDNGYLVADEQDFTIAADEIMNPIMRDEGGSQIHSLNSVGLKVLEFLKTQDSRDYTNGDLRIGTNLTKQQISQAINGRNADKTDGLIYSCPAIEPITHTVDHSENSGEFKVRVTTEGINWNKELYEKWVTIGRSGFILKPET